MAKAVRSKNQTKSTKAALKKLHALGIIRKPDLRKKPTRGQTEKLKQYADLLSAKPTTAKKSGAKARKGEQLFKTKDGKIIGVRKVGGRVVTSKHRKMKRGEPIEKPATRKIYAIPFMRGRDQNGKPILEWKRWPNYDMLAEFMEGYDYEDWADYVVEEEPGVPDVALREKLEAKLQRRADKWQKSARTKGKRRSRQSNSKGAGAREKTKAKATRSARQKSGRKRGKKR